MTQVTVNVENSEPPEETVIPADIAPVVEDIPEPAEAPVSYVSREEFDAVVEKMTAMHEAHAGEIDDLQLVVADVVDAVDDTIDYLRVRHEQESAEHEDKGEQISPAEVPTAAIESAKERTRDLEPGSRHRVRTFLLGRSGGSR